MSVSFMAEEQLPAELVSFLNRYVETVRQLEALLALQSEPAREFTVENLTGALRSDVGAMTKWLDGFCQAGLVECRQIGGKSTYVYKPVDQELDRLVALLAAEYKRRPLRVIDAILDRLTKQMMSFMSAFKIGKDGKGNDS